MQAFAFLESGGVFRMFCQIAREVWSYQDVQCGAMIEPQSLVKNY